VLLADDHQAFLEAVRSVLATKVDVVGSVDNGESLVEASLKLHPDVIVSDISMPKLNGLEAVDRLRGYGCPSKVVFLTAHSDPDFVSAGLKTGAFSYVYKASMAADLLFAVQEAFAGHIFVSSQE
jgi:DNA-binding NarL/FixJ family response regulator